MGYMLPCVKGHLRFCVGVGYVSFHVFAVYILDCNVSIGNWVK